MTATALTPGDLFVQTRQRDHFEHCASCRDVRAASDAAAEENGVSMQRRDRRQLGLRRTQPTSAAGIPA